MPPTLPSTLGELKATGYRHRSVKDELRQNLMAALRERRPLFRGIVGYDKTVVPQIVNALLAKHDMILLGLRGQAKTRIARQLTELLDARIPIITDSPLNEDPFAPVTAESKRHVDALGDSTPISWIDRDHRYREKLATPDVSMADLIGDIDPIKAANLRLDYSSEKVIHYGIIPRTNRGIFCINELPDLASRIQVGLLNIMQERDVQIRGFPVRLPLDVLMVFTANPEDYTNRGSIITPLKDRIESQIHTHYPLELAHALQITAQEAWTKRDGGVRVHVPRFMLEAVEEVAFEARRNEFLDQSSGVSARLPISLLENVVSNAERRALLNGETSATVRPVDFQQAVSAITGKVELVYQGEQQGAMNVARHLIGKGLKSLFDRLLPEVGGEGKEDDAAFGVFKPLLDYFSKGKTVEIGDDLPDAAVLQKLRAVPALEQLAVKHVPIADPADLPAAMELVLEGLHQAKMIGKDPTDSGARYYDMLGDMIETFDKENRK
jgi:magnesium chelatase subunit I